MARGRSPRPFQRRGIRPPDESYFWRRVYLLLGLVVFGAIIVVTILTVRPIQSSPSCLLRIAYSNVDPSALCPPGCNGCPTPRPTPLPTPRPAR